MSFSAPTEKKALPYCHCQPLFFNQSRFRDDLKKGPVISVFKDAIFGVNQHFDTRFQEGDDIRHLIFERATFIDLILHYAWHQYHWDDDIALIAVGGYGRAELHPKSDIDILILLSNKVKKKYDDQLQHLVTFLWDIGLDIGCSVRNLKECIKIAKEDITVATNLIEARRLAGNDMLRDELQVRTGPDAMWPVDKFFEAKCDEQQERHAKHNYTEYNLEPNIKNAPGGLRDIQTINWVAKRFFAVPALNLLYGQDFFTEQEYAILQRGEAFLWRVRYGVHMLSGRAEERLLFEYQRELAQLFGYEDEDSSLGVEKFMREYYRTVLALRELNDVLLQHLGEVIYSRKRQHKITPINERFQLHDNYIEVTHERVFDETPGALLEIFLIMGHNPAIKGVRPPTIRLLRESRALIDDKFRTTPSNNKMFLELFNIEKGLVKQLRRMSRYGILGRYLPAWGDITGQMQHDLFHRYTVDAHTLLVIQNLREFRHPESEKQFPIAAHIMKRRQHLPLLYLAGVFHDIGKGRGGDHSTLGSQDAIDFGHQHGLRGKDTRLIAWLVEKHLLMSYVSQKKDISDPEVIYDFALEVGDQRHLDYLYALTVADMRGTNPDIWNTWRASLMRQLYMETKRALRRGLENTIDKQETIEETQQLALAKLADKNLSSTAAQHIWDDLGDEYFIRESHLDIAWQTEAIIAHKKDEPLIIVSETTALEFEGATQIFIRTKDESNIFTAVANCLASLQLNIQDARLYSSTDGYTVDTFYVLDDDGQPIGDNPKRYKKIVAALYEELELLDEYTNVVRQRTPRALKQFAVPTQTSISNDIVSGYTVLEVISPDRTGLLATIGQVFMDHNIQLQNAKIATLGERVEDVFFVTDTDGNPLGSASQCNELQTAICSRLDQRVEQELAS
ncbi:[protein-PII] uridylyltransferase [Teredinibacter purpureus]|uniref:[protein-PII] uridylyltransferase n=1 Tax=Teredinibacter purpureus TaxID=2731756 RepID=UPI0005F7F645|nr:[protein-PII] uridylyltransferase [Teredinibacter purpureus]